MKVFVVSVVLFLTVGIKSVSSSDAHQFITTTVQDKIIGLRKENNLAAISDIIDVAANALDKILPEAKIEDQKIQYDAVLVTEGNKDFYIPTYRNIPKLRRRRETLVEKPQTVQEYLALRNKYLEDEAGQLLGSDLTLDAKEEKVNKILIKYKAEEFELSMNTNPGISFPAANHFFLARDLIEQSNIFKIIQSLPKGAALHMHDYTVGPSDYAATELAAMDNLYCETDKNGNLLQFKFCSKNPCNRTWQDAKKFLQQQEPDYLKKKMSMFTNNPYGKRTIDTNILLYRFFTNKYPETNTAWIKFEEKIILIAGIASYEEAFKKFYRRTLQDFYEDNVMYIEMRSLMKGVHQLGGRELSALEVVDLYNKETIQFKKDHPGFIGAKVIYSPHRSVDRSQMSDRLDEALEMNEKYPEFFAGFDMVGQEDKGQELAEFREELLKVSKRGLKFFFHSGETNWHGTKVDENLFDAIILNTERIGHGYALADHPELLRLVVERGIGVELCPISNQVLGLVKDIRNHPGKALLRTGFPVIIASDGPGIWGSKGLSHDWYYAFMAMAGVRADLKFLKQLAVNSIKYSAMSEKEKATANTQWEKSWEKTLDEILQNYQ